jgi:predicted MFS family arabinose efflux permease
VDRVGVRGPMLAGVVMILAAMVLAWGVPRLETLFIVSTVAGSGFVLYHIAASQAAGAIGNPEDRIKNFSLLALAFSTSGFLGPILAGFAIDGIGHGGAFLALAVGALVNFVVLAVRKIEIPRHEAPARHGEKRRLVDLLRMPGLMRVFVVSGTLSIAWDLFTFVTPIHGSRIGLSASTIGLILGTFGAAVFAVRIVLPLVARRVSEWRMLVMALLYERAPAGRGAEAVGVRTLLLNFGQASVPLAFGALGTALGMMPVFWAMGLALLAVGYFAIRGK